jgi:hypothetical protein
MFGDALTVGAFIAITLELFVSQALIDHAAEELSDRLVGAGLPPDLQAIIGDIVHRTDLVHTRSAVSYDIREGSNPDEVIVRIRREYCVWNYSKATLRYEPTIADEGFHHPRFLSLECFHGDNLIAHLKETDFTVKTAPESHGVSVKGPAINLEPYKGPRHADYKPATVIWTIQITVPADYSDVTAFNAATVGGFEIRRLNVPDGFEFDATRDDQMSFASGGTTWRYHRAYLPKQHLRVWWRPKPNSP